MRSATQPEARGGLMRSAGLVCMGIDGELTVTPRSRPALYIGEVTDQLVLITLLVKLGVVASVASILARASSFRRLFFAERRRPAQTLALLAFFLVPLTLGVWIRTAVPNFLAADISFETIILLGLFLGPGWATIGGLALALPAAHHGEYLALPFDAALGLLAGVLGRIVTPE